MSAFGSEMAFKEEEIARLRRLLLRAAVNVEWMIGEGLSPWDGADAKGLDPDDLYMELYGEFAPLHGNVELIDVYRRSALAASGEEK